MSRSNILPPQTYELTKKESSQSTLQKGIVQIGLVEQKSIIWCRREECTAQMTRIVDRSITSERYTTMAMEQTRNVHGGSCYNIITYRGVRSGAANLI